MQVSIQQAVHGQDSQGQHQSNQSAVTPDKPLTFSLDDPLIPELLAWISCAAILGGLAASVAIASCIEALGHNGSIHQPPPLPQQQAKGSSFRSSSSDLDDELDELDDLLEQYEIDTEAAEAVQKASCTCLAEHQTPAA